jgi:hypothetical protein
MNRKSAYDLLSVVGAIILFFSWIFQQSIVEKTNRKLANLTAAEDLYIIYQSHNAVFNSIIATEEKNEEVTRNIRRYQTYNYLLGLRRLAEESGTPIQVGYDIPLETTQSYLETVQKNAQAIRKDAEAQKATFGLIFNCGYGLGSLLVLLGSILKLRLPDK